MKISRYIRTRAAGLLTASAILGGLGTAMLLPGCASDDFDALREQTDWSDGTQLLITLAIPQGEQLPATATRAEESAPETDELKINSLRLIIFSESGSAVINRPLLIPSEMPVNPNRSVTYEVMGLTAGEKYRMYIVANMGEKVTFSGGTDFSESDLKDVMIDCTSQWPTPGNLPMVYEGDELIEAPQVGAGPLKKSLSLKYACVKVRMNLIFDKDNETETATNYGEQGFIPTSMTYSNASTKAPLLIEPEGQKALIEGTASIIPSGSYYDTWTETPGGTTDTKEIITVTGTGSTAPTSYAGAWLSRHTIYLPERYAESADDQLTFSLEGKLTDKDGNTLESTKLLFDDLKIGVVDGDVKATDLPRGSFYEIVARVKNKELEGNPMEATVSRMEWGDITIPVDFLHTYLTVSKTEMKVESLEEDYLVYETDGSGGVKFVCDDDAASTVDGKPAVVAVPMYSAERGQHLEFRVNPSIDITKVTLDENGELNGTATGYVIAGNIKKRVWVNYNMTPFFEITPAERTIAWVEDGENTAIFHYRTNLNGVVLTDYDNQSTVFLSKDKTTGTNGLLTIRMQDGGTPGDSEGYIVMTSTKPESTTAYNMFARPASIPEGKTVDDFGSAITVTVQPQLTAYRIYFRAINDYQEPDNNTHALTDLYVGSDRVEAGYVTEFLSHNGYKLPDEATEKWVDWWGNKYENVANNYHHIIYIYNQVGNNTSFANTSKNVCYFTQWGDYKQMTGDVQNAGWYYYDLDKTSPGKWDDDAEVSKADEAYYSIPRPNETLIIFHNHGDDGTTHHRLAHAKEPGVALGSFSDCEGWTLFDPTRDPRYTTYDNKPVIEDVAYTIYSDKPLREWYTIYGARNDKRSEKFRMYAKNWLPDNAVNGEVKVGNKTYVQNQQVTVEGKTYYKNVLWFKAVRDEYDKCLTLLFNERPLGSHQTYRFYFAVNDDNSGWHDPHLFIEGITSWGSEKDMVAESGRRADNFQYYYYDFSEDEMKNAIEKGIRVRDKNKSNQHPLDGVANIKLKSDEISVIKTGTWSLEKMGDYTPPVADPATPTYETTLFDGESYSPTGAGTNNRVIEGYFNTATQKWSKTPF